MTERWTIKVPAGTRAAVLRLAHARAQTVAEWLAEAAAGRAPPVVSVAPLAPSAVRSGALVRLASGGPQMTVQGPELLRAVTDPPDSLRCCWFEHGQLRYGTFSPAALVAAPEP